jgi:hypothetical protein
LPDSECSPGACADAAGAATASAAIKAIPAAPRNLPNPVRSMISEFAPMIFTLYLLAAVEMQTLAERALTFR